MTNYEMIKNQDIYAMALTIMCPHDLGFWDDYRCNTNKSENRGGKCVKCTLAWLEETSE